MKADKNGSTLKWPIVVAVMGMNAIAISAASAATWQGDSSVNWNDKFNWTTDAIPDTSTEVGEFEGDIPLQPTWNYTSLQPMGGIWVKGTPSTNIVVSDNANNNGTMQLGGPSIDGNAATSLLMSNTNSASLTINVERIKVGANQTWTNNSSGLLTINGRVDTDNKTLTVNGSGDTLFANKITFNGTNVGNLIKDGAGTLTLANSTNDLKGTITVSDGKLLVTGGVPFWSSLAVVTVNGGTLGGSGNVDRATSINSGAIIAPGVVATTAKQLTINHSLTLGGFADFDLVTPTSYDSILVNGANTASRSLTYGGSLRVAAQPGFEFASGQVFDLFDWGASTTISPASFAGSDIFLPTLPGGLSWKVYNDGTTFDRLSGQISVIPEPASLGAIASAGLGLLARRRRPGL